MNITEQLTQLVSEKNDLADNLVTKGVEASHDETFTTLVPKVLEIQGGEEPSFSMGGHFDREGLKAIGYTDEVIDLYDSICPWSEEYNNEFKLTDEDKSYYGVVNNSNLDSYKYKLCYLPYFDTSSVTNFGNKFKNYYSLKTIPQLDTSKVTSMNSAFSGCSSLITIPELDMSNITSMTDMFNGCSSLITIPELDTSNITSMNSMFNGCSSLKTIPQLDTSKVTSMSSTFSGCYSLVAIHQLDTSQVTDMDNTFTACRSLKNIPQLDTSKVTSMDNILNACYSLLSIPLLNMSSVKSIISAFYTCYSLKDLGGFQNLGEAYLTTQSANYNYYTLNLSTSNNLTHDSLMNVINNLYDIASKGCNTQKLQIGATNMAKLTSEEIAIATNKGWSVS